MLKQNQYVAKKPCHEKLPARGQGYYLYKNKLLRDSSTKMVLHKGCFFLVFIFNKKDLFQEWILLYVPRRFTSKTFRWEITYS